MGCPVAKSSALTLALTRDDFGSSVTTLVAATGRASCPLRRAASTSALAATAASAPTVPSPVDTVEATPSPRPPMAGLRPRSR